MKLFKFKKTVSVIIVLAFMLSYFSYLNVPNAQALDGGGGYASAAAGWAHFAKYVLKEFVLDLAARVISRSQLSGALKGISNQVLQSGRTGRTPAFIQNWRNLMTDGQYRGEDVFRAVLGNTVQCPYFRNELLQTFGVNRTIPLPIGTQNTRVDNLDPFTLRSKCTMPQAWSIREYQRDFAGNGGWDALVRLSRPQNNFYGSLLMSLNELNNQRKIESRADIYEGTSGSGYLGIRRSTVTNGSSCDIPPTSRAICEQCTTNQPGNVWCFSTSSCVSINDTSCTYSTAYPSGCSAIPSTRVNSQARCSFLGNVATPSDILGKSAAEFIDSNLKWFTTSDEISEVLGNFITGMLRKLSNYAADAVVGKLAQPEQDRLNTCVRQCDNTTSGVQRTICYDRCYKQAGVDSPTCYSSSCFEDSGGGGGGGGGPTPTPVGTAQCNDGLDNDNDSRIDFNGGPSGQPADPDCSSFVDNDESGSAPPPAPIGDTLNAGQSLLPGQALVSQNGQYSLILMRSGELVLSGTTWWIANNLPPRELTMQADGNLVFYETGGTAVWSTASAGAPGSYRLVLQNDGNLVIYLGATVIWSRF